MDNTAGLGGKMGDVERARFDRLRVRIAILRAKTQPIDVALFYDVTDSGRVPVKELK